MVKSASAEIRTRELRETEFDIKLLRRALKDAEVSPELERKYVVPIMRLLNLEEIAKQKIKRGENVLFVKKEIFKLEEVVLASLKREYDTRSRNILKYFKEMVEATYNVLAEEQLRQQIFGRRPMARA